MLKPKPLDTAAPIFAQLGGKQAPVVLVNILQRRQGRHPELDGCLGGR
jgi:hypothetical protein